MPRIDRVFFFFTRKNFRERVERPTDSVRALILPPIEIFPMHTGNTNRIRKKITQSPRERRREKKNHTLESRDNKRALIAKRFMDLFRYTDSSAETPRR